MERVRVQQARKTVADMPLPPPLEQRQRRRLDTLSVRPERAKDWPTLAEARADADLTQQRLAEIAGVSIATVRDIERFRKVISRRTWGKLTKALGVEGFRDVYRLENR
jgi:DNA-binding XRE family transcriptional regulator